MKVTLLDGGVGQEIYLRSKKQAHPLWSIKVMLDNPEIVIKVHEDFIKSGSKVICLNTYTASESRLKRDGKIHWFDQTHKIAIESALKAIKNTETSCKNVQISGCLPPLVASYKPNTTRSYENCLDEYSKIVELQKESVDFFICETMSSILEAKSAVDSALNSDKKVLVSFTIKDDQSNSLRSGEKLSDAIKELELYPLEGILLNCSSIESINNSMKVLKKTKLRYGAYANGFKTVSPLKPGGTVDALDSRNDLTPDVYSKHALNWINEGATIIGGCCEIGPKHIKRINDLLLSKNYEIINLTN